jgi:methyl-accepting chemotaxis protein
MKMVIQGLRDRLFRKQMKIDSTKEKVRELDADIDNLDERLNGEDDSEIPTIGEMDTIYDKAEKTLREVEKLKTEMEEVAKSADYKSLLSIAKKNKRKLPPQETGPFAKFEEDIKSQKIMSEDIIRTYMKFDKGSFAEAVENGEHLSLMSETLNRLEVLDETFKTRLEIYNAPDNIGKLGKNIPKMADDIINDVSGSDPKEFAEKVKEQVPGEMNVYADAIDTTKAAFHTFVTLLAVHSKELKEGQKLGNEIRKQIANLKEERDQLERDVDLLKSTRAKGETDYVEIKQRIDTERKDLVGIEGAISARAGFLKSLDEQIKAAIFNLTQMVGATSASVQKVLEAMTTAKSLSEEAAQTAGIALEKSQKVIQKVEEKTVKTEDLNKKMGMACPMQRCESVPWQVTEGEYKPEKYVACPGKMHHRVRMDKARAFYISKHQKRELDDTSRI